MRKLAQWGDRLLSADSRLEGLLSTSTPAVPGTGGPFNGSALVSSMDADLLLAVLSQNVTGKGSQSSPLFLAVDMRAGGDARQAGIVLNATAVAGWTPIEGDDQAGFASCNKLALGSRVSLALDAGDAALFTVTLYDDA